MKALIKKILSAFKPIAKYLIIGGLILATILIVLPNVLTSRRLNAALRANEQLRAELTAAREDLAEMRTTLASTAAANRALRDSLEASRRQLDGIRTAIDESQAVAGRLGETNQELIRLIRSCLQLIGEIQRVLGGDPSTAG